MIFFFAPDHVKMIAETDDFMYGKARKEAGLAGHGFVINNLAVNSPGKGENLWKVRAA
mgnify:FL=1